MLTLLLVNIGYEREFMITKCGLDELSVVVVDASLTELVLKHNDLITSAMYKRRCAVVVRFSRYAVFVLEVQRVLDLDGDFQWLLGTELSRVNGEGRSMGRKLADLG